jgi:hypothetical protein
MPCDMVDLHAESPTTIGAFEVERSTPTEIDRDLRLEHDTVLEECSEQPNLEI